MPDYQCCHFCFWCSTKEGKKWCKYEIEEEQHEIKNDYKECCCYFEQL